MAFTILGAGAIGGVIGAYLARAGVETDFIDIEPEHVATMNKQGLTIALPNNEFTVPVTAFTPEGFLRSGRGINTLLLCVKAHHTRQALAAFVPRLGPDSAVVSFQNGLCECEIAELVGSDRTIGCFVNLFADYLEPGRISYGGAGSVYIGEIDGSISARVQNIVGQLAVWGPAQATSNIFGYLWGKLAYGAILATTALTNETIADIIATRANQVMLFDLAAEILEVANRDGVIPMGFDDWNPAWAYPPDERNWPIIDQELARLLVRLRSYTKTRTGIWRDIAVRKRETEVPAHLLPVIARGESYGIDLTLTKAVLAMIRQIEDGSRSMSLANIEALHKLHEKKTADK